jgi:hypothetical protein
MCVCMCVCVVMTFFGEVLQCICVCVVVWCARACVQVGGYVVVGVCNAMGMCALAERASNNYSVCVCVCVRMCVCVCVCVCCAVLCCAVLCCTCAYVLCEACIHHEYIDTYIDNNHIAFSWILIHAHIHHMGAYKHKHIRTYVRTYMRVFKNV